MSMAIIAATGMASVVAQREENNREAKESKKAEAEKESCKLYIKNFESKSATIQQSQEYARCVYIAYPEQGTFSEFLGGLGVALLICFGLFGIIKLASS